ncbi:SsgA family sporulation/cell division regulator [Streptomyces paludis]|uniref:SsgA family sporulation/cell division regulator n=1 Tax=Streptomyces paludis TaxID=2282738 RepID=A0A345HSG1_9ACTN|nr:SsgA family sporulation/cell division regulator [Streptomyces paludis]AXG79635.1 SsgA family sporulation/cell division regulator [Streptomyces paludis]
MSPAVEQPVEESVEQPPGQLVEQPAKARLITDAPQSRPVTVTLRHDGADPGTVRIAFPPEVSADGDEVVWAFARTLLETGLRQPAGDDGDDVQVWPCGRAQTVMEFHSPDGVAVVQFDSAPLRRFLASTYAREERAEGGLVHRA